jgi:hypothetical protein
MVSQPYQTQSAPVPVPLAGSGAAPEDARLPLPAKAYILLVVLGGIACLALFAPRLDTHDLDGFIVFALLAIVLGRTRIPIYGDTTVSTAMVGDFAIAFLYGPAGAVIVAPFTAFATDLGGGAWYKRIFNIGSVVVVNGLVAWMITAEIGVVGDDLPLSGWLIPIALCGIAAYYLLNVSLVTFAVALASKTSVFAVWREKFDWLIPHYVVFGLLGLALAAGYSGLGYAGLLAFLAPPLMMRFAIKQYLDKTTKNVEQLKKTNVELERANRDILVMADQLRETYDGTLEALVTALDARDQETKGHSVRVAKYMMEIAYHVGVEPGSEEWVNLQRGGLLHDIGKIGVSDTILHKPGPLDDFEWVSMKKHPRIGYDVIKDIAFLSGAAEIVLCHHERFDGKGYPRGLAADEIPLAARIFALADTFDAMTSDRPYRAALPPEAARDEIIRCSGTQFDPRCVQAFLLAWDRIVDIRYSSHDEVSEHHAAAAPRAA